MSPTPPDDTDTVLSLSPERLDRLYPAYIFCDGRGVVLDFGPFYRARGCPIQAGDQVGELFVMLGHRTELDLPHLAASGDPLTLRSRDKGFAFGGSVLDTSRGYLLALNIVPDMLALEKGELKISDFSPDDPAVQALMTARVQSAMIAESRGIAEELAKERQRGLYLLERVRRVTGFMAHDFNNYLSIIKLNCDRLLLSKSLSAADRRLVQIIVETGARGSEITRSLMTMANQKTDAKQILSGDEVIRVHYPYLAAVAGHDIEVELNLGAKEALIDCSRMMFTNCLINLVTNAREAGCTKVTIATTLVENRLPMPGTGSQPELRTYYAVRVTDNGPGIPSPILSQVFQPLFSTKSRGSGLGLASIMEFAHDYGGDAGIESQPGEGTSVCFYIPLNSLRAADFGEGGGGETRVSTEGARMLVVEDEPYALEALIELLEGHGFAPTGVEDVEAAEKLLEAEHFDLLLTDIVLHEASGLELARQARASNPDLNIALMSGYVPEAGEIPHGWHFIRKPLNADALVKLVNEALTG
jgi:signal transduction histidine kinase